jgi:hypothetical protein
LLDTHPEHPSVQMDHPGRAPPLMKAPLSNDQAERVAPLLTFPADPTRLQLLSRVTSLAAEKPACATLMTP